MLDFAMFALIACYNIDGDYKCFPEYAYETEQECIDAKPKFEKIAGLDTILFCGPNAKGEEK